MVTQRNGTLADAARRVVVPIKLATHVHDLLKAVVRLGDSTRQASCVAQAEATMARGPFQGFHGVLQLRAQPHLAMLAPREHA